MRIVISYDGSDGAQAALEDLTRAGLGKTVDATIASVAEVWLPPAETSLEADESFPGEKLPDVRRAREIAAQAIAKMQSLADEAKARLQSDFPTWRVSTEVLTGSPWWEVINRASELDTDLIVVGSHGRSTLGRFFLGSISQKVLNEARCSVRLGRKPPDASGVLLVAVDGSRGGEAAVHEVATREWPSGIRIYVISAEDPTVPLAFGGLNEDINKWVGDSGEGQRDWVQKMVEASAEHLRQAGLDALPEVKQGDPKKVLVEEAKRLGADCIFVGASGLTNRLERFLLGSVSTTVANRAECSVEVVRLRR